MVVLIILNIILVIILVFLVFYLFYSKKHVDKNKSCCMNYKNHYDSETINTKQNKKINSDSERVFEGRFITEEEYEQMVKNRRSDVSILLEELDNEYERLKELNK